jgi:hypothetical protein
MDSPAGEECAQCVPGEGCSIFTAADERCRSFACMYRQMPHCGEELRPDRCGVVFEKLSGHTIYGTIDPELGMDEAAKRQTVSFQLEGFSVILDDRRRRKLMVAPGPGLSTADAHSMFVQLREVRCGAS